MSDQLPPHPAKFSDNILAAIAQIVDDEAFFPGDRRLPLTLLDPFAGTGKIHQLDSSHKTGLDRRVETIGVEIEPEWAAYDSRTLVANALHLPFGNASMDVVATSCCVTPDMRVLTADLRWVAAGDLRAGDRLFAFDEQSPFRKANGNAARRKYSWSEVTESRGGKKRCMRVILSNGDQITTTDDHPWLAHRSKGYSTQEWIQTQHLTKESLVLQQFNPWSTPHNSFDAGWLAGMYDGEGSLSFGVHGSPAMQICQVLGAVNDNITKILDDLGFSWNQIERRQVGARQVVMNTYITGGWPDIITALGRLRPIRLLEKFQAGDVSSRTIQPKRVQVVSIEDIGMVDIQSLTTSTGTFICEGYLHHNTYGNRMADHHVAKDSSKRMTYTHQLGRQLDDNNSGKMHWGPKYWEFHEDAWAEMNRVLKPGGLFILNAKDFLRTKKGVQEYVGVAQWHIDLLLDMGYSVEVDQIIPVKGMGFGSNGKSRVDHERVIAFRKKK